MGRRTLKCQIGLFHLTEEIVNAIMALVMYISRKRKKSRKIVPEQKCYTLKTCRPCFLFIVP